MAGFWQLPTPHASLFGKLPTVLDYVRINHSYPVAIALDEWLSRSLQDLTVASVSWPAARYRFLFAPSGSEHAVAGVFGPSRDRAGRKFPLSVFAPIPMAALTRCFAALPQACAPLFDAADQLLDEAATLSRDDAAARLESLPLPSAEALEEQHASLQVTLDERSAAQFVESVYGAEYLAEDAFARATATLGKVRAAAPDRALTLDCPVASVEDVSAWLSLPESCLNWAEGVPSLFWTTSEPGRLLISFGTPLSSLPVWLADKKRKSDRLISLHAPPGSAATPASYAAYAAPSRAPEAAADADYAASASAPNERLAGDTPARDGAVTGVDENAPGALQDDSPDGLVTSPDGSVQPGDETPETAPVAARAPAGPSLWRKLRELAVSV